MKRANYNTGQVVRHKNIYGAETSLGANLLNRRVTATAQKQIGPIQVRGEGSSRYDLSDRRGSVSASTQRKIKGVDVGAHARTDEKGKTAFSAQASKTKRSRKGDLTYGVRANNNIAEMFFEYRPK
jgi:hypothetical protein|tara:strand:- start:461 stop:838 length:378 start_codon:yes stop_codon:yes gene_type:complete